MSTHVLFFITTIPALHGCLDIYINSFWPQSHRYSDVRTYFILYHYHPSTTRLSRYTLTLSDHSHIATVMSTHTLLLPSQLSRYTLTPSDHSLSTSRQCSKSSARQLRPRRDFSSSRSWAKNASPVWRKNCLNSQRLWATMSDSAFRISRFVMVNRVAGDAVRWDFCL